MVVVGRVVVGCAGRRHWPIRARCGGGVFLRVLAAHIGAGAGPVPEGAARCQLHSGNGSSASGPVSLDLLHTHLQLPNP